VSSDLGLSVFRSASLRDVTRLYRGAPHREDGFPIHNVGNDGVGGFPLTNCGNDDVDDAIKTVEDFLTQKGALKSVEMPNRYRAFGSRTCRVLI
jgi:hypothetical protein